MCGERRIPHLPLLRVRAQHLETEYLLFVHQQPEFTATLDGGAAKASYIQHLLPVEYLEYLICKSGLWESLSKKSNLDTRAVGGREDCNRLSTSLFSRRTV